MDKTNGFKRNENRAGVTPLPSPQSMESFCSEQSRMAEQELSCQQEEVKQASAAAQKQTITNSFIMEQKQVELLNQVETGRQMVNDFLQDELQQDVPTGATPQRRDFVYPRDLVKSRRRSELLDSLRREQQKLQAAMEEEEHDEDEDKLSPVEHDSLEDEPSTCNESVATESSFIDENLVFNESKRVPFFKQKKGGKETKLPLRPKLAENDPERSTPQKSRLPLRCQN